MAEPVATNKWFYWATFLVLVGLVVFIRLIPSQAAPISLPATFYRIEVTPDNWAMPDLLICLCYAWVLRRPEYMPVLLIALTMLFTDMLFMRPPGLLAALFVLGAEFLRGRASLMRELPFLVEWAVVAGVLSAVMISNRIILFWLTVPQASLWLTLVQLVATLAAYPLVVLFSRYVLGVRKIAPGELDVYGQRL